MCSMCFLVSAFVLCNLQGHWDEKGFSVLNRDFFLPVMETLLVACSRLRSARHDRRSEVHNSLYYGVFRVGQALCSWCGEIVSNWAKNSSQKKTLSSVCEDQRNRYSTVVTDPSPALSGQFILRFYQMLRYIYLKLVSVGLLYKIIIWFHILYDN